MGVYEGRGQLARAMKDLQARWLEARSHWDDSNAEQFEEKYIQQIAHDLRAAVAAMDGVAIAISQANHDCRE